MSLDQKDLEIIERIIYKNGDDIAVSISRSFERLEERVDASESRIYSRLSDIDDKIPDTNQFGHRRGFAMIENTIEEANLSV